MAETDEVIVRLVIVSESRTPEQLTALIGLPSDESWRVGEIRSNTIIVEKNNGWLVESQMPRSASLPSQVTQLLDRLSPYRDRIKRLSREEIVAFSCVVYSEQRPALVFSNENIQRIAELGADLDVDVYIVEPD